MNHGRALPTLIIMSKRTRRDGDNDKVCLVDQPDRSEMMSVCFFFPIFCHTEPNFSFFVLFCLVESSCWYK